jgi:hypothetical protein
MEPAGINDLRNKGADRRMHPVAFLKEDAVIFGDRRRLSEQVLERLDIFIIII